MPRRSILLFAGACIVMAAALALVTMVVVQRSDDGRTGFGAGGEIASTGQPQLGGPFELTDQEGRPADQSLLQGRWSLVFFGFTYCPDYCPTTLTMLEATRQRLGEKGQDLQIVFISVDPERDTPKALKDYLSSEGFPKGVIGLTGTPDQIAAAARAYAAPYQKVPQGETYTMNHGLTIYLMGPDGHFRTALAHDLGPQRAAEVIERAMARG